MGGPNDYEYCTAENESGQIDNYINHLDDYIATCVQMDCTGECDVDDYEYASTDCGSASCVKAGGFLCPWPGCECAQTWSDCCMATDCMSEQCEDDQCDPPEQPDPHDNSFVDICNLCGSGIFDNGHGEKSWKQDCYGNCPSCGDGIVDDCIGGSHLGTCNGDYTNTQYSNCGYDRCGICGGNG